MNTSNTELIDIQNKIKGIAEILAEINLKQNKILTDTDQCEQQIATLKAKCQKKKKQIEQEIRDKVMMQERLIDVQRKRENAEKKHLSQQQAKAKVKESEVVQKVVPKQQNKKTQQSQSKVNELSSKIEESLNLNEMPQKISQIKQESNNEENSQYQPPPLFNFAQLSNYSQNYAQLSQAKNGEEENKQNQQQQINEQELLQRIRRNFQQENNEQ